METKIVLLHSTARWRY